MLDSYNYFTYEGFPCRIETKSLGKAEIYKPGVGFVDGPKMTILSDGVPISKSEFDAMILTIVRKSNISS
jgi:hypothetical protein